MFIELPNGSWVRPSEVTGIMFVDGSPAVKGNPRFPHKIRIDVRDGCTLNIPFRSAKAAREWSREFAGKVNAAQFGAADTSHGRATTYVGDAPYSLINPLNITSIT